ncbi:hypothetical protein LV779_21765 [Streptomyces thinghirensis]|nr:hypothetical protein [Streptomyces thinghirensis]
MLRGESLEAVDPAARDRAERLAGALGAPPPHPCRPAGELPGEAAALAAFRKVRAERPTRAGDVGRPRARHARRPPMPDWSVSARAVMASGAPAGTVHCMPRAGRRADRRHDRRGGGGRGNRSLADAVRRHPAGPRRHRLGRRVPRPAARLALATGRRAGRAGAGSPTPGAPARGSARDDADGDTDQDTGTDKDADADGRASGGGRPGLAASCRDVRAGKGLDGASSARAEGGGRGFVPG